MTCLTAKRLTKQMGLAAVGALALASLGAPTPATAQVRALLPTIDQMEPLEDLPIDGVWEIREIGKRIIIVNGHAYAQDSWVHMFLFRIEPDQVVIKNIRELANGDFIGQDLPLTANITFEWISEDTLRGRTDSLIPVTYHLDRADRGDFGDDDFRAGPLPNPRPGPRERPGDDTPLIDDPLTSDEEDEVVDPW